MDSLRQLSLRTKLVAVVLASCAVSALVISASLFAYQEFVLRRTLERELASVSRMVAVQASGAVIFKDSAATQEILGALRENPEIIYAAIRLPDDSVLAELGKAHCAVEGAKEEEGRVAWHARTHLRVRQPIRWQAERVGTLELETDVSPMQAQRQQLSIVVAGLVLVVSLGVALGVSHLLQGVVSGPILQLTRTAQNIAEAKDYSVRVLQAGGGEVGLLTTAFNLMLDRIQSDDRTLRQANHTLANEVAERLRTEELLRDRLRVEAFSADVSRALSREMDLATLLKACCDAAVAHLDVAWVRVWTVLPATGLLELQGSAGPAAPGMPAGLEAAPASLLARSPAGVWEPLIVNDLNGHDSLGEPGWIQRERIAAFGGFPLQTRGELVGVFAAHCRGRIGNRKAQAILDMANGLVQSIERRKAESALQASQSKLEALVHSIEGIVWECTPDLSRFMFVSRQSQRILGYAPEQWLEEAGFWESRLHPEDAAQALAACRNAVAQAQPYQQEFRMRAAEDRVVWIRACGGVLMSDGRVVAVRGIFLDITAQKEAEAELSRLEQERMELSRQAGMAEVATGVLHNVGNVLNSVNVSVNLLADGLARSRVTSLQKTSELLRQHEADLAAYLTSDPKGALVPGFLIKLTDVLLAEHRAWVAEVQDLARNIEHSKEIVAMQQSYARVAGVVEALAPAQLLEDALRINEASLARHGIRVERDFEPASRVVVDRHKTLQILTNLIHNARQAVCAQSTGERWLRLGIRPGAGGRVEIVVQDNGVGIAAENLTRIFAHGFTTKPDGHGFGLHSGALAATEMGGALRVASEGVGRGATFTLDLPAAGGMGL